MRKMPWAYAFTSTVAGASIRTKIMGIVAASILCAGLAMVWYAYRDVSAALRHELRERGIAIGTSLASQSRELLLTNNQFLLYTLIRDQNAADEDLVYAFVVDGAGNVLTHSFDEGFPSDLLGANQVEPGEAYSVQTLQTKDDRIQDVAVPVIAGRAGVVRVGMSEAAIRAAVTTYIRNVLLWVAVVMVLGLYLAYGLASILTRPISRLAEAARATGKEGFKWESPAWAKDEIGSLGSALSEMSEELRQKGAMREQLLASVISAQEEERTRIARELHDETSQALTSLMVGLRLIEDTDDNDEIRQKVGELRALARHALAEVHNLAVGLRPSSLDDLGLVATLEQHVKDFSQSFGVKADFHAIGFDGLRLPPQTEITLYRIVQEALTNVAKHAGATEVSVLLEVRRPSIVAIIEDDGRGFDVPGAPSASPGEQRLGLHGMQERASLIDGLLTIESAPGTGTAVFVGVPLKGNVDD